MHCSHSVSGTISDVRRSDISSSRPSNCNLQVARNGTMTKVLPEAGPTANVLGRPVLGCNSSLWVVDTFLVPLLTIAN